MSKWLINRLHCCSLPRQSQQDLTNAEPPQFSLLGQEAEVPGAPHPSTASSSVQSYRGFKGRKQIPVFETSAPGGPCYCSLTSMGGGGTELFLQLQPRAPWLLLLVMSSLPEVRHREVLVFSQAPSCLPPASEIKKRQQMKFRAKLNLEVLPTPRRRDTELQRISLGGQGEPRTETARISIILTHLGQHMQG